MPCPAAEGRPDDAPLVLHNLASLYRSHFQDPERARRLFLEARSLYRPGEAPTDAEWDARAAHQLGLLAETAGRLEVARGYLEEATAVRSAFDRCGRATALSSLALLEQEDGRPAVADERMAEAMSVLAGASCTGSEAGLDLSAGELAERRGKADVALVAYRRGAERSAAIGDRRRLADALSGVARAERRLGRPSEALAASRQVLAIVEEIRPTVLREDLRTAFFATAQDQYDLHIALLSDLGRDEEAWATAERARAQALRDLLEEAGAGLRRGADPVRVERERMLRHEINRLERQRVKAAETDPKRSGDLRREIDDLVAGIERVRGDIRRASPAYASLVGSASGREPLTLADARRVLLPGAGSGAGDEDGDTLLLEYRLGEEESRLWAIGASSFDAVRLPPRAEIERLARVASRWARSLDWRSRSSKRPPGAASPTAPSRAAAAGAPTRARTTSSRRRTIRRSDPSVTTRRPGPPTKPRPPGSPPSISRPRSRRAVAAALRAATTRARPPSGRASRPATTAAS